MNVQNDDMKNLLPLYFEGKLDAESTKKVEAWIEESEEHAEIANTYATIYSATDDLYVLSHTDTEAALGAVSSRMGKEKKTVWLRRFERVAAVLLVPLLVTLVVALFYKNKRNDVSMVNIKATAGMIAKATLPDGSHVTLNSGSSLSYPTTFSDERTVKLHGEAFFDVAKDAKHPFIVQTPFEAQVKVYGTHFDVETRSDKRQVIATLAEGSVGMQYKDVSGKWTETMIIPGEQVTYDASAKKVSVHDVDLDVATSWKDGRLVFKSTPLREVLDRMETYYNVRFTVRNAKVYNNVFTGTLEDISLENALEVLDITSDIHFRNITGQPLGKTKRIEVY